MNRSRLFRAMISTLPGLLVPVAAQTAGGAAVECRSGDAVRRIEVVRDPSPDRVCEARRTDPGPSPRVVWFAEHDRGFCHERADALIATLAREGWVCDVMRRRDVAAGAGTGTGGAAGNAPALVVPRPR